MRSARSPSRRQVAARERGVVSLEFAAIAPVLLLMIIGAFDIARAIACWQQTLAAAQWVAMSASDLSVQVDSSTSLTPAQATMAMTAIYGAMPQIQEGLYTGNYSVTLSGVYYTPAGLANAASIIWSVPLLVGNGRQQTARRTCGTVQQVATMPQDSTNLKFVPTANVSIPTTLVVADVHYRFTPMFFNFITGPIDFWETYPFPLPIGANNQSVCYDIANPDDGYLCPGYVQALCSPQT
jgi:Flp pilus assembly protein TadG